jgi:hypothetical protein
MIAAVEFKDLSCTMHTKTQYLYENRIREDKGIRV